MDPDIKKIYDAVVSFMDCDMPKTLFRQETLTQDKPWYVATPDTTSGGIVLKESARGSDPRFRTITISLRLGKYLAEFMNQVLTNGERYLVDFHSHIENESGLHIKRFYPRAKAKPFLRLNLTITF